MLLLADSPGGKASCSTTSSHSEPQREKVKICEAAVQLPLVWIYTAGLKEDVVCFSPLHESVIRIQGRVEPLSQRTLPPNAYFARCHCSDRTVFVSLARDVRWSAYKHFSAGLTQL